jgi:hypothetical protein
MYEFGTKKLPFTAPGTASDYLRQQTQNYYNNLLRNSSNDPYKVFTGLTSSDVYKKYMSSLPKIKTEETVLPEAPPTPPTVDVGQPPQVTWEEAYKRAFAQANPQFDILRGRTEQQFSQQREQTPQLLAAKYGGLAGLRGGRREAAESALTQKEAMAIQELEAQRQQAISDLAVDIQTQENTGAYQRWLAESQLKQQEAQRQWEATRARMRRLCRETRRNLNGCGICI